MPAIYLRFVVHVMDTDSGRRQGIFQAAAELEKSGALAPHELREFHAVWGWFRENLKRPTKFAISSRPHAKGQSISWIKAESADHIARLRELQRVLEDHGVVVEALRTDRPGYITYEDEHQVAAYPFADTPT